MTEHRFNTSKKKYTLERLFAMIWVDGLTPKYRKEYSKHMCKCKNYERNIPAVEKLYDYYMLYKWPIADEKLQKLIKKYKGI